MPERKKRTFHQNLGPRPDSMIGKTVHFGPPGDVKDRGGTGSTGVVEAEVWVPDLEGDPGAPWGEYCFFAQRIRWEDGSYSIRLGYYRRRTGEKHWEFGSQTTVNSNPQTIRKLLEDTLGRQDWFGS
jgi:hypothetical protein